VASIDTIADRSTGSEVAGKAYFETSTNKFIIYNGSSWVELDSDGTGAGFIQSIDIYDSETDFINETNKPAYTIVHAKDTDKLYVWDGSAWYIYNHNSMV